MNGDCAWCDQDGVQNIGDGMGGPLWLCEKHATAEWHIERMKAAFADLGQELAKHIKPWMVWAVFAAWCSLFVLAVLDVAGLGA